MVSHVQVGAPISAMNPVHEKTSDEIQADCSHKYTESEYTQPDIFFMPMDDYHKWIATLKAELDAARKAAETTL